MENIINIQKREIKYTRLSFFHGMNKLTILFIVFIYCQDMSAQEVAKDSTFVKKHYNLAQFSHETILFIKHPAEWKARNWILLGGVTAGTILTMTLDQPVRNSTQGNQHFYHSAWIEGGRIYGEWYSIPAVAGAFGLYGVMGNSFKSKIIAVELIQAGLYSEFLTFILKYGIGRARPYNDLGHTSYHLFSGSDDFHSIPSGHSTSAFALSAVISSTSSSDLIKFLAYVPAGFTLFSRIYQDKHWISDAVGGAVIGYFVGNWVADLHSEKKHQIKLTSIYPPGISYSFN
jgi:hypothetical protein